MLDLGQIRNEIDGIDKQLVELFEQRMKLTKEVAEYKIQTGKKVLDREREKAKIESVTKLVKNKENVHAIDDLFPERATLHGLQVAWGHLLVEREFRQPESDYEKLLVFFERMKMLDEIERDITFSKEEVEQIILRAKTIRDRYTILSKV